MIKALIFDMDGVLADSEDLSVSIAIDYFRSLGRSASKEDFASHQGQGDSEFFSGTARDLGIRDFAEKDALDYFRAQYTMAAGKAHIALPGLDIISKARKAGIAAALATSSPSWKVDATLPAIGLDRSSFDIVLTGEDIRRNKPYGDIYSLALIRLGLDGSEAVVFEDTGAGIEAAHKAGCLAIGVSTTFDSETISRMGADAVISDLGAIADFSSSEELSAIIDDCMGIESGAVVYGANFINPLQRRMPESFTEKRAVEAARKARKNAYAPYSGFKVGAAIVSAATGRIYSGCNVENSSYGATICAERNAITTAISSEGAIGIDILVVASSDDPPAPPCAQCLQVLAEFSRPDTQVVLVSDNGSEARYAFSELLPHPFIFPTMRK